MYSEKTAPLYHYLCPREPPRPPRRPCWSRLKPRTVRFFFRVFSLYGKVRLFCFHTMINLLCVARKTRRAPIAESSFEHVDAVVAFRGVSQGRASGAQGRRSRGGDGPRTRPLPLRRALARAESVVSDSIAHRQGDRQVCSGGCELLWSGGVQPISGKYRSTTMARAQRSLGEHCGRRTISPNS